MKSNYERFELESSQMAPMRITSFDIKRVHLDCRQSQTAWENRINSHFSAYIGLATSITEATLTEFQKVLQTTLTMHSESFNCYWSSLFVPKPLPLRFDSNTELSAMRTDASDKLKKQIDCANYLLHKQDHTEEKIDVVGDSHKEIEDTANRLLAEHLKKQLKVRTRPLIVSSLHQFNPSDLYEKYKPDVCLSLQSDFSVTFRKKVDADALLDQYESEKSRLLQKYEKYENINLVRDDVITAAIKPLQLSAIDNLNRAQDEWRHFFSERTRLNAERKFSMDKCRKLLRENDPAAIVKPFEDRMRKIVADGQKFNPLDLIDRDKFVENAMSSYITTYEQEAKLQFDVLFKEEKTPLQSIIDEAKQAMHPINQGFDVDNYKTLRVLVDCVNSVGWKESESSSISWSHV